MSNLILETAQATQLEKRKEALAAEQVRAFQVLDPILRKMNAALVCNYCTSVFGPGQDVIAINAMPGDTTFTFECKHAKRIFTLKPRGVAS
jgi:hypothetical protein